MVSFSLLKNLVFWRFRMVQKRTLKGKELKENFLNLESEKRITPQQTDFFLLCSQST